MNSPTTRREFLERAAQTSAIASAVAALGGVHVFADEKPDVVRFGLIGCGGIMTHHVKGLVERREAVSIPWLCDVDPGQMDRSRRQHHRCQHDAQHTEAQT